jgi:hypothetical protein
MPGSHAANQSKTESMPPTEAHADPADAPEPKTVEAPELDGMNVDVNDPQSPRAPGAAGAADAGRSGRPAAHTPVLPGAAPDEELPTAHAGTTTGLGSGPDRPVQDERGYAQRHPGNLGTPVPTEQIETDVARSAQNTSVVGTPGTDSGPGNSRGVPVPSEDPLEGSSEASAVAQGSRTPQ